MLVLSRKVGEKILIGPTDNPVAVVTVLEIRRDKIRLGVECSDRKIDIVRGELAAEWVDRIPSARRPVSG